MGGNAVTDERRLIDLVRDMRGVRVSSAEQPRATDGLEHAAPEAADCADVSPREFVESADSHGLLDCVERVLVEIADQRTLINGLGDALNRAGHLMSQAPNEVWQSWDGLQEHLDVIADASAAYHAWKSR